MKQVTPDLKQGTDYLQKTSHEMLLQSELLTCFAAVIKI